VSSKSFRSYSTLQQFDPLLAAALAAELNRQERYLELIASENYVSPRVLEALGSVLTNKYADGLPGNRMYSGCEFVDVAEQLAIERAAKLFSAQYVNVQPYSGTQANAAAYHALLEPGDTLLGMEAGHGGHITHGAVGSFSSRHYSVVQYGIDPASGDVDYEAVARLAHSHRPKLIVAGFSAYSRIMDWERFRAVADDVGALLLIDMAHVAGLVAAGLYPNPVPYADVVTTTTHKTLRGPRGGMILARDRKTFGDRLDRAVYPGTQGGPLMHVVAAKAVAFAEALEPEFREYQQRVIANARRMAQVLQDCGQTIWSGGTDNHMLLVDTSARGIDAKRAERLLEDASIAVSCMGIPGRSGGRSSGLRLGTPAITTRGLTEDDVSLLAQWIAELLEERTSAERRSAIKSGVDAMCEAHPVYASGV
jgi:glycine hydroxymethyltransferase